ncbi:hypothetical protein AMV088 [Betaentomopoxvirus amoorei]|uniref:AMV088 n=1 Tax=Amsacta moorei entomopoxvirus TaxID=28321 RepID=Q9EMW1_AMEPV|nr:hypothetical protein AMV088 [Amsacta moorei entomopoxvirus]AAG02794.1 AMV088 [Amsacta moorei entomopoxvirus]
MNTCGSYGDDIVLEYKVPIRTNVNVQSGAITSKSNAYSNTGRSNCNSCGTNGYSTGVGYSNTGVRSVSNTWSNNNWDNNPSCVVETRGSNRYRTCYYRDGTSTVETYPV